MHIAFICFKLPNRIFIRAAFYLLHYTLFEFLHVELARIHIYILCVTIYFFPRYPNGIMMQVAQRSFKNSPSLIILLPLFASIYEYRSMRILSRIFPFSHFADRTCITYTNSGHSGIRSSAIFHSVSRILPVFIHYESQVQRQIGRKKILAC